MPTHNPTQDLYLDTRVWMDYGTLTDNLEQRGFKPLSTSSSTYIVNQSSWERRRTSEGVEITDRIDQGNFEYGYDELIRWPKNCSYRAGIIMGGSSIAKAIGKYDVDALNAYVTRQLDNLQEELSDLFVVRKRG